MSDGPVTEDGKATAVNEPFDFGEATADPYVHVYDGGAVECRHRPQPDDREGHYPDRRGLVHASPIVRDVWTRQLDEQEAESEERYWRERSAQEFAQSTFGRLLRDPTQQFDPEGEVLASIVAYQNALPATACGCRGSLHKTCGAS